MRELIRGKGMTRLLSTVNPLDAARILLSLMMLGYASWIDLRTREIYDLVWVVFGAFGLIIAVYEVYSGTLSLTGLAIPVVFSVVVSFALGYLGLFGGADVLAFITLAVLNPCAPRGIEPYLGISSIIYPLTLFSNSALAGASFAVVLFTRNLTLSVNGRALFEGYASEPLWRRLVMMATGYKIEVGEVRGPPFQYPLELPPEEGAQGRRLILLPDIEDDDAAEEVFRRLREAGYIDLWVSYTLPFIVFIAIGYLLTLFVGDIALFVMIRLFLT